MELRQLAHFVAVAEELHFTRAAARVHVVQSSLSASIHALEREVGAELFVRDSRHVALTQAGRALLPAARRALSAADEGRDAVAGVRGMLRGPLHVGAIQTLGVIDLPALLARFSRAHPEVSIRLSHDAAPALARAAADAQLDVAFIDGPTDPARVTRINIGHDDLILAVPRGGPLAQRTSIRLDDPALREAQLRRLPGRLRPARPDRRGLRRRGAGPANHLRSAEYAVPHRTRATRSRRFHPATHEPARGYPAGPRRADHSPATS
jgi:DNA-binding transcriptional LysR family regulator